MTPEELEFEREKWQVERQWRESEERRKEREARAAIWRSPILLSIMGAIIAIVTNIVIDRLNAQDKIASEEDRIQAGLVQDAFKADDADSALAKLQLLNDAKMVPRYSARIVELTQNDRYARVFTRATGKVSDKPPPDKGLAPGPGGNCLASAAGVKRESGWIYLGRTTGDDKTAWDESNSTFESLRYDDVQFHGRGQISSNFPAQLKDKCLTTLTPKYLREEGRTGQRVQSAVRRVLPGGTRLRIVEVDDTGTDPDTKKPVVWARVEVL